MTKSPAQTAIDEAMEALENAITTAEAWNMTSVHIDDMECALEKLKAYRDNNGWLDIETAPRDGAEIDVWVVPYEKHKHRKPHRVAHRDSEMINGEFPRLDGVYYATHWRLPPEPPKDEGRA